MQCREGWFPAKLQNINSESLQKDLELERKMLQWITQVVSSEIIKRIVAN